MSTGPFGQPQYQGPNQQSAPEQSAPEQGTTPSSQGNAPSSEAAPEIPDISTLEKFRLGDREMTSEQLRKELMMQRDYTRKTQELKETVKYWKNLKFDLAKVRARPALADEFRKTYPQEFHEYLDDIFPQGEQAPAQTQAAQGIPQEFMTKLQQFENYVRDQEVSKHEAQIEATFSKMSKKYPEAHEEIVLARAQALLDQNPGFQMNEGVWDKLFKSSHEAEIKRVQSKQKQTLQTQRSANQRANDTSGGGTPGSAPAKMKLKDVADYATNTLRRGRG